MKKFILSALVLPLFLASCNLDLAIENDNYTWYRSSEISLPMQIVVLEDQAEVVKQCQLSRHIIACAKRVPSENVCLVYTSYPELPEWVIQHEKKHCDGWSHLEK